MPVKSKDFSNAIPLPETAFQCGIEYQRLWRAAVRGAIPAHRIGGKWRVLPSDLPVIRRTMSAAARA